MRPPENPATLGFLDKRAECELVLETLDDPLYKVRRSCAMPADFMQRFVLGTHAEPFTHNGNGPTHPIATGNWRAQPEFEVTEADAPLIKLAATRKLYEIPTGLRVLTRHGRAARRMLKAVAAMHEEH